MTPRRRTPPPDAVFRLGVFVPAIMSVGMTFWLLTLARDAIRWRSQELEAQRATVAGRRVAERLGTVHADPRHYGLRDRPSYVAIAIVLLVGVAYVLIGSIANYGRPGGYVQHQGWLLMLAVLVSGAGLVAAVGALNIWWRWPPHARWVRTLSSRTPLTTMPIDRLGSLGRPSWRTTAAALILPASAMIITLLVVTEWAFVGWVDRRTAQLLDFSELDELNFLDPVGSTVTGVALAAVIGISTLRCRPFALAYPIVVAAGLAISHFGKNVIDRERPPHGPDAGTFDSFPSGHLIQAVLIAGLVPLAVALLAGRRGLIWPTRALLLAGVVGAALYRIDEEIHWATDVAASVLFGSTLVVFVHWVLQHESWHAWCHDCLWSTETTPHKRLGVIDLHISMHRIVRVVSHTWAAGSVLLLTYLTVTRGIPTDPEGAGLGPAVQKPIQLTLAGIASIGALLAWRWEAVGAVLLALAGTGLGIFAAVEYEPWLSILLAALFIAPAVLLWLSWQHRRTIVEIIALATVTAALLGATWAGATEIHDRVFGPTHPDSTAAELPVDRVEWLWMGGLRSDGVTVVVGVGGEGRAVRLTATPQDGGAPVTGPAVRSDGHGTARVVLTGLRPDTDYAIAVEVDGELDTGRGRATLRTAPDGAGSFRLVVGACARTGSNGAVFDAMRDQDALLYLALGDLHYQNIDVDDAGVYRTAYRRMLTQAGPADLYRSTPLAYVWDDHDYGPNDSDSSAPGRDTARAIYREMVPHHPLVVETDGPIHHAFSIGRVRVVMTDSRSARDAESMLGADQVDWLTDEIIEASRTHAVVLWGNPVPWVSESADGWGGWADERQTIADALAGAGVDNLVMVSGDAHMVAIDDGTNTDFSSDGAGGFPLLHAAALDRPGNVKGGPYSSGVFPGGGQYGVVDVEDDGGDVVTVTLSGHTWDGETLVEQSFAFAMPAE